MINSTESLEIAFVNADKTEVGGAVNTFQFCQLTFTIANATHSIHGTTSTTTSSPYHSPLLF